ncbi:MAG: hypothetical protein ACLFQX_06930 [Candidatus Kapaibacterium sp.]
MKIPGLNPYQAAYANGYDRVGDNTNGVARPESSRTTAEMARSNTQPDRADELLSRSEREFFIKLFPENSEQIENHVLFNRQGRMQSHNINKGMIVDGRV